MPLDYLIYFVLVLRGIYTGKSIYASQTYIRPKLRIFLYSEVIHGSTTYKLQKRQSNIEFYVFVLCFVFFIPPFSLF